MSTSSKWVEQDGSPDYVCGPGSTREYTRIFRADSKKGLTLANNNGYRLGITYVDYDGLRLWLRRMRVTQGAGYDLVTLTWDNSDQSTGGGGYDSRYNDGVQRAPGDEEWSVSSGLDQETVTENSRSLINGTLFANWGANHGIKLGDAMLVPGATLVWRKWLEKVKVKGLNKPAPRHLPRTKAEALDALRTYMPQQTGGYEGGGPKVGQRLVGEPHLLCVSVDLSADGDLVCRTAQYKWSHRDGGWPSPPYM